MQPRICILIGLVVPLACRLAAGGWVVQSGDLRLDGGSLQTDAFATGADATLAGNGTLDVPAADLQGTVAPCGEYPAETGTLAFTGDVQLDGTYLCKVNADADVDLVVAAGLVSGAAEIAIAKDPAAIPLGQIILQGGIGGDVSGIALIPAQQAAFRLEAVPPPVSLALTDLLGDTDGDQLPDWWEYAYYTNRTLALPGDDDDGDHSINLYEEGAGTDPRDPDSVFAIVHVDTTPAGLHRLTWNSVDAKTYAIQATADSANPYDPVVLASNLTASAPLNGWTNPVVAPPNFFYRVVVEP